MPLTRAPLSPVPFEARADDLRFALAACVRTPHGESRAALGAATARVGGARALVTASARAAFDLVLHALALEPGDEVLFTPTIAAMPGIAREHELVPVAVDIDRVTLAPDLESLERAIGSRASPASRARVLVIAHLFGARADVSAAIRLAHARGLVVVEDRAQAFHDPNDHGHPEADVVIHSFGVLKTASAFGGALTHVREPRRLAAMEAAHAAWPVQTTASYARVVLGHLALRVLATRRAHAAALRTCERLGTDLDALAMQVVCNAKPAHGRHVRRERPSPALVSMLARRLATFEPVSIRARVAAVRHVASQLPPGITHVGGALAAHAHWVLPVATSDPMSDPTTDPDADALVASLRGAGLYATRRAVALCRGDGTPLEGLLGRVIYLPFAPLASREEHGASSAGRPALSAMHAVMAAHLWARQRPSSSRIVAPSMQKIQEIGAPLGP